MGVKVAVIGAGSTYTPELVEGFVRRADRLAVDELALLDPDADWLGVVGGLARRMLERGRYRGRLLLTADREAAVEGADFVIVQLRVGGQAARRLWPCSRRWPGPARATCHRSTERTVPSSRTHACGTLPATTRREGRG